MTDHQCPSCGGICKKSGCERVDPIEAEKYYVFIFDEMDNLIPILGECADWEEVCGSIRKFGSYDGHDGFVIKGRVVANVSEGKMVLKGE